MIMLNDLKYVIMFKLNKVTMIIKYCDNVYNEKDLKRIFYKYYNIFYYINRKI